MHRVSCCNFKLPKDEGRKNCDELLLIWRIRNSGSNSVEIGQSGLQGDQRGRLGRTVPTIASQIERNFALEFSHSSQQ